MSIASLSILVLLSTAADAWKVKIAGAFSVSQTCVVTRMGATNEWTVALKDPSSADMTVLASFSQAPTSCEFKKLGDATVAPAVVTGADNGMLTVRVLNTCQTSDDVRVATLCGTSTVLGASSTAPPQVVASSCNADCAFNGTSYCETQACSKAATCSLVEAFASFSFPVTVTKQSAACVIGAKPPVFGPTTAFTAIGMPSGNPTDDSLSTCCAARGTAAGGTAAGYTAAAAGTTNDGDAGGNAAQVLLSVGVALVALVAAVAH